MEEYVLKSCESIEDVSEKTEEVLNKKILIDGSVIILKKYIFRNCEFEFGKEDLNIVNKGSLVFFHCKFICRGIKENRFLIDSEDDSVTEFYSCDFEICENLLRCKADRTKICVQDSVLSNPGEKFMDILMGTDAQVILGNLIINLCKEVSYDNNTVVFRIARVTESVQPLVNNVKINAEKFIPNVKWFLCMGGEVSGGTFINVCSVFDGVNKVNNAYFENCSQVINWAIPVVRKYGISNWTTAWINENIEIRDNTFVNCSRTIGLGYLSNVDNCKFRHCTAPMIVTSIHGGVTITDNIFEQCELTSDEYSSFIMLSDYQDEMSEKSLISGCKVKNSQLSRDQFVRIILNKNSGGKVVRRKSLRLENCSFINSVRNKVELIEEKITRGSLKYELVDGINSCSFEEEYVEPIEECKKVAEEYSNEKMSKPYDGGNFDDIPIR